MSPAASPWLASMAAGEDSAIRLRAASFFAASSSGVRRGASRRRADGRQDRVDLGFEPFRRKTRRRLTLGDRRIRVLEEPAAKESSEPLNE